MAGSGNVSGRRAFAKHLLDRVSGDQMNEKEHEADHQPDYWQGVEDALEDGFQETVLSWWFSGLGSRFSWMFQNPVPVFIFEVRKFAGHEGKKCTHVPPKLRKRLGNRHGLSVDCRIF